MKKLLKKEMSLSASLLTYLFILFTLMTFIPGYPILMSAFFVCFGIFQSVQFSREDNDILFSVLLPVRKRDIVTGKYLFAAVIQMIAFAAVAAFTALRMTVMSGFRPYTTNALMNANLAYLGFFLIICALFNTVFLGGFFRTAYYFGKPFVLFIVVTMIAIFIAEAMHHVPGLERIDSTKPNLIQLIILCAGVLIYAAATVLSCRTSQKRFEKIDL
ncbi:MAG: ABC-2 transporter permease [Clostridia bacterium]|nr:ABC-2 transporter permease [Clostridia bacterium]